MKLALVAAICLLLVAVIAAERARPDHKNKRPPPSRIPDKRCSSQADCNDNECCLGQKFRSGRCRKLGREGKRCMADNTDLSGKFAFVCPCAEGLSCIAEKVEKNKFGKVRINERCRATGSTEPPPEVTTEDEPILDTDAE